MHSAVAANAAGQHEQASLLAVEAQAAARTAGATATAAQSVTDQQQPLAHNMQCSAERQPCLAGNAAQHTALDDPNAAAPAVAEPHHEQAQQPCSVLAAGAPSCAALSVPMQAQQPSSTPTAAAIQQLPLAPYPAAASAPVQPFIPQLPRSNGAQRLGSLISPRGVNSSSGTRLGGLSNSTGRLGSLVGSSSSMGSGTSGARLGGLSTPNRLMGLPSPTGSSMAAFAKPQYANPSSGGRRLPGLASPAGNSFGASSSFNTGGRHASGSLNSPLSGFSGSAKPLFGAQAGFSNGPRSAAAMAATGRSSSAFKPVEPALRSSGGSDLAAAAAIDVPVAQQQQVANVKHSRSPSPQLPPLAAGTAPAAATATAADLSVTYSGSSTMTERSPSPAPAGSVGAAAAARCWSPALPPHSGSGSGTLNENSANNPVVAGNMLATAVADSSCVTVPVVDVDRAAAAAAGSLAMPTAAAAAGVPEAAGQCAENAGAAAANAAPAATGAPMLQSSLKKRTPEVQLPGGQLKKVRFNDRVQVFVLPPPLPKQRPSRSKKGGSKAAAAAAEEEETASVVISYEAIYTKALEEATAAMEQKLFGPNFQVEQQQQQQQQQGQWVAARYAPELSWRKFRRYKQMAQSGDDVYSDPTVADAVAAVAAMEAEKQAEAAAAAAAASNSQSGEEDDTEDVEAVPGSSQEGLKKRKRARLGVARKRNPAVAAAAAAVDSVDPEELEECYRDAAGDGVWSLWHDNPQTVAPLKKGSALAAAVEAMLAEEGLDPKTAAAVMGHVYKEKKAPGVAVIRGRIQRFKAVIAPYRRPSMLLWLRKCPRLINNAEATLSTQVSQMLALFSPGLMLPSQAAELLDKCPQLAARTATVTKTKIDLFIELFGREAVPPLLLRFPVILTMSTGRIRETVALVREMLSGDNEYSKLLLATLKGSYEASKEGKLTGRPADAAAAAATVDGAAAAATPNGAASVSDGKGADLPAESLQAAAHAAAEPAAAAEGLAIAAAAVRGVPSLSSSAVPAEGPAAVAALEAEPNADAALETGSASTTVQQQQQQRVCQEQHQEQQQQQQQQPSEVSTELVHHLLMLYPAFFIHQPTRVREHYVKYQAMQEFWNTGTGSVTGILTPVMLPDWHFALLEDRIAYLQATSQADKAQGISCHGLSSPAFNSRFPDFPAWREQQRGVPASKTQTEFPHKKSTKKRKSSAAAANKTAAASGSGRSRMTNRDGGSSSSGGGQQQAHAAGKKRSRSAAASDSSEEEEEEEEWQSEDGMTDGSEDGEMCQEEEQEQQQERGEELKSRRMTRQQHKLHQRQQQQQQQEEEEQQQQQQQNGGGGANAADALIANQCKIYEGKCVRQQQQQLQQQPSLACEQQQQQQPSMAETESEEGGSGESELSGFVGEECEQQEATAAVAATADGVRGALTSLAAAGAGVPGMQQQADWLHSLAQEVHIMQQTLH